MYKHRINAAKLRQTILRAYRELWEKAPDNNEFAITQNVWKPIWETWKGKISEDFASAVLNSLHQEGLVENIIVPNPQGIKTPISRITQKGLMFLADEEDATRTRRLALLGASSGCLALILAIADWTLTLKGLLG